MKTHITIKTKPIYDPSKISIVFPISDSEAKRLKKEDPKSICLCEFITVPVGSIRLIHKRVPNLFDIFLAYDATTQNQYEIDFDEYERILEILTGEESA